jgi:hypothetical protein
MFGFANSWQDRSCLWRLLKFGFPNTAVEYTPDPAVEPVIALEEENAHIERAVAFLFAGIRPW